MKHYWWAVVKSVEVTRWEGLDESDESNKLDISIGEVMCTERGKTDDILDQESRDGVVRDGARGCTEINGFSVVAIANWMDSLVMR
ncbi:unnamed protein product [Anisakis simplex]|uniref:Ovule protein n=1 Tax=Anisakis simplex TaxID=6269 RepID=A0A0M3J5L3_ANISI|nr:unnamed protein product [Anisakis simplex]